MIKHTFTVTGLEPIQKALTQAPHVVESEMALAVNDSLRTYQSTARIKLNSLSLREGIRISPVKREGNAWVGSVGSDQLIHLWHEQGTGIYGPRKRYIVPVKKKILAWHKGGVTWKSVAKAGGQGGSANGWIFAKRVRGMKPKWFMRGSFEENSTWVSNRFQQAGENIIRKVFP